MQFSLTITSLNNFFRLNGFSRVQKNKTSDARI
jgi:hypothetical protein